MIKKLIKYLLLILLLLFGLEKIYDFVIANNANLKTVYVTKANINARVVVSGPSNAQWMFDPEIFEEATKLSAYNLGSDNSDFIDNYCLIHLYLKHNISPEYLLLQVSPRSMDQRFLIFRTSEYGYWLDDDTIYKYVQQIDPQYTFISHFPFMRYGYFNKFNNFYAIQGLSHFVSGKETPYHPKGYYTPNKTPSFKRRQIMPERDSLYRWDKSREVELLRIITLCKQKNIKCILYKPPIYSGANQFLLNKSNIILKIDSLAQDQDIPFWNFDTLKIASDSQYFFSYTHTNRKGTANITKAISEKFKENFK